MRIIKKVSNRILVRILIDSLLVACLLFSKSLGAESNSKVTSAKRALTTSELKPIVTFLNSRANNGFILSTYENISDGDLFRIIYNSSEDVSDLTEISDYLNGNDASSSKKEKRQEVSSSETKIKKISLEKIKSIYLEKTGKEISNSEIQNRLENTNFKYISTRNSFYTESLSDDETNYVAIKAIEGLVNEDGNYQIQITSRAAATGDRSTMYTLNGEEIESTIVTLKPQDSTYFFVSNIEANDASLLFDNGLTSEEDFNINDLDYDFTQDYISQYENESKSTNTTENKVVVRPKSNVPTAIVISTVTIFIIGVLVAIVGILNKKLQPKKFDMDKFKFEEIERKEPKLTDKSLCEHDIENIESNKKEKEIEDNPVDEEEAEKEIEALADARSKSKPIVTAFDKSSEDKQEVKKNSKIPNKKSRVKKKRKK